MRLSPNFSLHEFERSQTAARRGIDNRAPADAVANLRQLCLHVLQPIRDHFDKPVVISSGYRSPALNRRIGGSRTSQHMTGEAADIEIMGIGNPTLARWIEANLPFDQLILEMHVPGQPQSGWVHVSYRINRLRRMVLTKVPGESGYRPGLLR